MKSNGVLFIGHWISLMENMVSSIPPILCGKIYETCYINMRILLESQGCYKEVVRGGNEKNLIDLAYRKNS